MKATNLSKDQQQEFFEEFCMYFPGSDEECYDSEWGTPWTRDATLSGDTIKDMTKNYWNDCGDEIAELLRQEEEEEN